ncbi:MAG: type II toxin-antitoxin system mRNA interferase toxin, RelE/StbE family [Candidatus Vogelbacteria bacterium]|nr:type II toxin-antitoxin system mRNA interferase toxin, RelE/StbE family [Candidatus Vogelbacteria bacterium]
MEILYTSRFLRAYKKLSAEIKNKVEEKEKVILKDIFNKTLKTHKLRGDFEGFYALSVDYKNRIIFELDGETTVVFYDIGSHDIY